MESLFEQGLPVIMQSHGGSMRPAIPQNARVRLIPTAPDDIHRGNVVVFEQDDGYTVMHRVVRRFKRNGEDLIQTWGDNVRLPDPAVPIDAVKAKVTAFETADNRWNPLPSPTFTYLKLFFHRYCWYWCGRLFIRAVQRESSRPADRLKS